MAVVVNFNSGSNLRSALAYAQGKGHKGKLADSFGVGCSTSDPARDFANIQSAYGRREDKTRLHRMEISFANNKDGKCEINKEDAKDYVKDFVDRYEKSLGGDFQCYVAFHQNSAHYHAHLIFNSVSAKGKKYRPRFNSIKYARSLNDSLARKYNLHVVQQSRIVDDHKAKGRFQKSFYEKYGRPPYSYKSHARQLISRALLKSNDLKDFGYWMDKQDCKVMPNFYNNKVKSASIIIPNYYRSGKRNQKNPFRTVKTSRLGYAFEKGFLRSAATGELNDKLMDLYRELSKKSKYVQVFDNRNQRERKIDTKPMITAKYRFKGVPYKSRSLNQFSKLKDNYKIAMKKEPINYNHNFYSAPTSNHFSYPTLNGMTREEREEVLEAYKEVKSISNFLDSLFNSADSIFKSFKKSFDHRYQTFNKENENINTHTRPEPLAKFNGMSMSNVRKYISQEDDDPKPQKDWRYKNNKARIDRKLKEQEESQIKRKSNIKRNPHFHI